MNCSAIYLFKSIKIISIFQVIFSTLVFIPILHPFIDFFKGRLSDDSLQFHFYRFSGSLGYPTEFGCFLVLCFMLIVEKGIDYMKFINFLYLSTMISGILFSASRGAILLFISYILYKFIISLSKIIINSKVSKLFIITGSTIIIFIFIILTYQKTQEQLTIVGYLLSFTNKFDSSLIHRFNELKICFLIIFDYLDVPTGVDRLKPFGLDVIESFWGFTIIRFGIVGLVINLSFIFIFYYMYKRSSKYCISKTIFLWFLLVYTFVAPFSDIIFRSKGVVIFGLLLGISLNLYSYNRKFYCLQIDR